MLRTHYKFHDKSLLMLPNKWVTDFITKVTDFIKIVSYKFHFKTLFFSKLQTIGNLAQPCTFTNWRCVCYQECPMVLVQDLSGCSDICLTIYMFCQHCKSRGLPFWASNIRDPLCPCTSCIWGWHNYKKCPMIYAQDISGCLGIYLVIQILGLNQVSQKPCLVDSQSMDDLDWPSYAI